MTAAPARRRWTDVHWVGVAAALALFGDSALYVVLPRHREDLGLTAMQVGILLSANRFVRIGLNDPTARVLERVGLRAALPLALLLAALTTAAYGHVGFTAFLVLRILWGLSWSFLRNGANVAVLREEPARRGELQGTFRSLSRLGSLAAVVGGVWLVGRLGFTQAYEWLGWATLPGALLALATLGPPGPGQKSAAEPRPSNRPEPASGTVAVAVAAFLVNALGASMLLVTLGSGLFDSFHRQQQGGWNAAARQSLQDHFGMFLGLAGAGRWIGEILVGPLAGYAADRVGRRPVLVASGLLGAGALGGCATAPSPEAFVASTMFAFAMLSAFQTALDALATDRARSSAVSLGRYFTVVDVGTAVGALVGPPLAVAIGFPKTAAGSAAVVALVAIAYMRRGSESGADHARLHADG